MSISKIIISNFVCVLTNETDTKHIIHDFLSVAWVISQGWDFRALGVPRGGRQILFFKHGHVAYQIDGDDEQNKMQVTFPS